MDGNVGAGFRPLVDLAGPGDAGLLVMAHFPPVGQPAGHAAYGEKYREHVGGEARGPQDEPGVEIHVGVELAAEEIIVLRGDFLQLQGDVEGGVGHAGLLQELVAQVS